MAFNFGIGTGARSSRLRAVRPWQSRGRPDARRRVPPRFYHPVGIAMLVAAPERMGQRCSAGTGCGATWASRAAALLTGGAGRPRRWRAAFFVPGLACIAAGAGFLLLVRDPGQAKRSARRSIGLHVDARMMARIFAVLLVATACGGIIFKFDTVSMPKVFDERAADAQRQTNFGHRPAGRLRLHDGGVRPGRDGCLIDRFELRRLMIGIALAADPGCCTSPPISRAGRCSRRRSS